MNTPKHHARPVWGLALLPLCILTGCASQQAVSEQTDALGSRIARLEASIRDTAAAAQAARELAAGAQHRLGGLEARVAEQAAQLSALGTGLTKLEARALAQEQALARSDQQLNQGLATARQALEAATAAGEENARQAAQIAALSGEAKAQLDRLASAEGRLGEHARRLIEAEIQIGQATAAAQGALERAGASHKRIEGKLVHTLTLTSDHYTFPLNSAELDSHDMAQLDELAARLKNLGEDYYLEIQGHTDDSGYGEYNYLLGEARANAVSRYLHSKGGVPLHRMSVISYGAAMPAGAQDKGARSNRRVVILVLK